MNRMVNDLKKFYEEFEPKTEDDIFSRQANYQMLKNIDFFSPASYRLPSTVNPMLDALLPHTPYRSKAELVYELLMTQINELSDAFPGIQKSVDAALQKTCDDFNKKSAESLK